MISFFCSCFVLLLIFCVNVCVCRSLLEENITYVPDTCLKTKTHLVKKPLPVSSQTGNDCAIDQTGGVSQTASRKPSTSSQESKEVSSSDNYVSCTSDTVLLSENSHYSLEAERRERKKKKKQRKRKSEGLFSYFNPFLKDRFKTLPN